ncbi:hypothetical protein SLA2020_446770, partial [Shorea laevis]
CGGEVGEGKDEEGASDTNGDKRTHKEGGGVASRMRERRESVQSLRAAGDGGKTTSRSVGATRRQGHRGASEGGIDLG